MGITDKIKKFVTGEPTPDENQNESQEDVQEEQEESSSGEVCALCNKTEPDKKWAGQYWHKQCLRKMRKMGKGMI